MSEKPALKHSERLKNLSPEKRALLELMARRERIDGGQLTVRSLVAHEITHIYAVSGVPVQEMLGAAVAAGIRVIGTRHQQAAVLMATAHNYVAGKIKAVVVVSAGPAVTNVATGLLVARDNAWPIIVIGGRRHGGVEGQNSFQELDGETLYKTITKQSLYIEKIDDIADTLKQAFDVAASGRPGPVYLDLLEDALHTQCASSSVVLTCSQKAKISATQQEIEEVAALLRNAKQPAFILGKGTRWSLIPEDLAALIEQHHVAFITSPMGRGILPDGHPHCFNRAKTQMQATADVVVVLGARLNWTFRFGSQINPQAKVIHVDIDSDEVRKNHKVSLGIVCDAGEFVTRLRTALQQPPAEEVIAARESWHSSLSEARDKQRIVLEKRAMSNRHPMSCYRLMKELADVIPADAILIADGNISMMAAQHVIAGQRPFSRFTAATNGCIGVGVPFAIGAKLCNPSRPVVVVCGDMAFGISGMELETAVRYKLPIIVVVVNNEGLSGGHKQRELYPKDHERVTMFEPGIRYEKIAEAFGAQGEYIDHPEQIGPAMARALQSDTPVCINIKADPYEVYVSEL